MKKITLMFAICFLMAGGSAQAAFTEPSMGDYTAMPIFSAQAVKPNIMIVLDNSGSMNEPAYRENFAGAPYFTGEFPISNTLDDMEGSGAPNIPPAGDATNDLDLGEDVVGLRFQNIEIEQGTTILSASIEFVALRDRSVTTNLTIEGEANDNAPPFTAADPITNRTGTTATVAWNNLPAWTTNTHYNSPDITTIVQEIVDRGGWGRGNAMVFRISGSGERDAYPLESSNTQMPILHIETQTGQGKVYYGYFNPDYFYRYTSGTFVPAFKKESFVDPDSWKVRAYDSVSETLSATTSSLSSATIAAGLWDGNWLNWLCMRRTDVLRKVIVGGLSHTRGSNVKQVVEGEDPNDGAWWDDWSKTFDSTGRMAVSPFHGNFSFEMENNGNIEINGSSSNSFDIKVQKEPAIEPQDFDHDGQLVGVLQRIGDKARWGNTWFNRGGTGASGGTVETAIDNDQMKKIDIATGKIDMVENIQDKRCTTSTPLAETMYTVTQYFKQQDVQTGLEYPSDVLPSPISRGGDNDPYYDKDAQEMVPCAKSFVILLTDGGSTADSRIPNGLKDFDNDGNDTSTCTDCSTNYLDDVAFYARTQDLRDDLDDDQYLNLYTIFAFANDPTARDLLMDAARNGGFVDRNGNNEPDGDYTDPPEDRLEWDKDGDAIPDTYFEASDGYAIEARLLAAITDILKRAASGTAASVLSTNNQGAGNSVQAYFKPVVQDGVEEAQWYGYMQSLWVDPWGNLREDTDGNRILGLRNTNDSNVAGSGVDRIVEFFFDTNDDETKIRRYTEHYLYNPNHGDEETCESPPQNCTVAFEELAMDNISPIFEAGQRLAERTHARDIFTYIDKNSNGAVDAGEEIKFTSANRSQLTPYFGVRDGSTWGDSGVNLGSSHDDRVNNLIEWTRGNDVLGLRNRTLSGVTWRLGDIISSTPMMVGMPQEFYHELYGDLSYLDFIRYAKDRETVVYAGANDGMLHAFTSWYSTTDTDGNMMYKEPGVDGAPGATENGERIGDELWAYIPQSVLPHLKWNAMTDYTHTYYVDGPVRVFDAKILPDDTYYVDADSDPNFGTFLVFGLGMGAKEIMVNEDFGGGAPQERTFTPSYTMMDVTDPRKPKLMWERSYSELGMTTSTPTPVHVGSRKGTGKWYLVFGSGPTDYDGLSTQQGHVFVVDMITGDPIGNGGDDWIATSAHDSYFNEPLALDLFQSHNADTIFFANNYLDNNEWKSDIWKIAIPCVKCEWDVDGTGAPLYDVLKDELEYKTDPTEWLVYPDFFQSEGAVTAQLSSTVDPEDNLLLFFGTGRYISESDRLDTSRQFLYSVKDPFYNKNKYETSGQYHNYGNPLPLETSDLLAAENIETVTTAASGSVVTGYSATNLPFWDFVEKVRLDEDGWYLPLVDNNPEPAERIITQSAILGGIVLTPTFTPTTEICGMGGDTTFVGVFYETGTGFIRQLFDIDVLNLRHKSVDGETAEIIEIRDDDSFKGMPAPKTVFHAGKESGAKITTQVGTGEFVSIGTDPAYYFKSMTAEWWDDPDQAPQFQTDDQCGW